MSNNKTTIQAHNDRLAALVEQVDALPDAGGGTPETCTVTVGGDESPAMVVGTILADGVETVTDLTMSYENMELVKGTMVTVAASSVRYPVSSTGGLAEINYYGTTHCYIVEGDGTITISDMSEEGVIP